MTDVQLDEIRQRNERLRLTHLGMSGHLRSQCDKCAMAADVLALFDMVEAQQKALRKAERFIASVNSITLTDREFQFQEEALFVVRAALVSTPEEQR